MQFLKDYLSESQRGIRRGEGNNGVVLRRAAVVGVARADRAGAEDARGAAQGAADRGKVVCYYFRILA